jgi:hypothetical protein
MKEQKMAVAEKKSYFAKLVDKTPKRPDFVVDEDISIPCPDTDTYILARNQTNEDRAQEILFGEQYKPLREKFKGVPFEAWQQFVEDVTAHFFRTNASS